MVSSEKPLKILYVCSELAPLISTGGLADVANALPRALHALGHDVRLAIPCYSALPPETRGEEYCICVTEIAGRVFHAALRISRVPNSDIPLYLIEHHEFFSRNDLYGHGAYEFEDNALRFCVFSSSVLDGVPQVHWTPDIIHCHDWHTAVIPAYLKTRPLRDPAWRNLPTLFTIHNLNYQGRYPSWRLPDTGLPPELFTPDGIEFYGDLNLMKAGIAFATKLNTVSPQYAKEIQTFEYGAGLDGFLRTRAEDLSGILNGVDYDVWSPVNDPYIPACYTADDLSGKKRCKAALQERFGLPLRDDAPVFGMVTRISWQKGVDVLLQAVDEILAHDIQLIVLGAGDPFYEQAYRDAAARHPGKMAVEIRFDTPLSHLVEAGSDYFLMPSRYEPCGLSQMYSLAYGTIPVVQKTGGLVNSVHPLTKLSLSKDTATGIMFAPCEREAIIHAAVEAIRLFERQEDFLRVRQAGMRQDFSWDRSAKAYVRLYHDAIRKARKS